MSEKNSQYGERSSPEELSRQTLEAHRKMLEQRLRKDEEVRGNSQADKKEVRFNTLTKEERNNIEESLAHIKEQLMQLE